MAARAYLLGYNCADEKELKAALRFCWFPEVCCSIDLLMYYNIQNQPSYLNLVFLPAKRWCITHPAQWIFIFLKMCWSYNLFWWIDAVIFFSLGSCIHSRISVGAAVAELGRLNEGNGMNVTLSNRGAISVLGLSGMSTSFVVPNRRNSEWFP